MTSYSKQRSAIEREYGQFLKRDGQRGRSEGSDSRSVVAVWKGIVDGAMYTGQAHVAASESYRAIALEASKTARVSKERMLKKSIEQLQKVQAELLETVKELGKAKKQFMHLQRSNEVAKDKAADVEARLRRSDRGIFHTKASLQKLSAKFSAQLAEYSKQLPGVHNEYVLTLVSANAHLDHYYRVELPTVMEALDGDLYERLRDHLTLTSQTEIEICQATQEWFQRVLESSTQISREQNLLLFLQDHTAFTLAPEQRFQLAGMDQMRLLEPESSSTSESSLEKEVRRWANRAAKDYKIKTHSEQVLQRLEARRQQAPEAEVAATERRMDEVKENIRKAEGRGAGACQHGLRSVLPAAWLVRALYDYEGQSPEELSFPEGAIIRVLPRAEGEVDDGFWTGDFNGRVGVFPSLVVEELTGAGGSAGQELPSPSPPPFSPPGLVPGLPSSPAPELCQAGGKVLPQPRPGSARASLWSRTRVAARPLGSGLAPRLPSFLPWGCGDPRGQQDWARMVLTLSRLCQGA
ncbi:PREDICTED: FCH and double SH3 domains protein 1 [Tinamus guttatus]|uniref:FCH and double SH3 domains protein 1 n=1 Tax=Tinamus guttatus TaxID=94827 RepID=UPI00052F0010|nr:PREDICTED: FCH and double SH3 domains protein 1 [Tinamus guttatus]